MSDFEFVLQLGRHIIYSYFENTDIQPLLSHFADDIIWIGAGKHMQLKGYDAVCQAFSDGYRQLVPCVISNAEYTVRQLSSNTWLCQICSGVETDSSYKMFIREYQRCLFIFQKNAASRSGDGWEIIYLNNSIAYNQLHDHELFAMEYGICNLQKYASTAQDTQFDKKPLYDYVQKNAIAPFDAVSQKLLLSMSLFPTFTSKQAEYMMQSPKAENLLTNISERNIFLHFDDHNGTYKFHPLLSSYLRDMFSKQDISWQKEQQRRAACWYLLTGDYKQSILLAYHAGDYDTVLTAIEQARQENVYNMPYAIANDTLTYCSPAERLSHMEGCLHCVLYIFRCGKPHLTAPHLSSLERIVQDIPDTHVRQYYAAYLELLKGYCAYPDIAIMTKHVQKARHVLPRSRELILPWTFGSPSPLALYYRSSGTFQKTAEQLQQFTLSYMQLICSYPHPQQAEYIRGEYEYLTGNLDAAEQILTQYIHSNPLTQTGTPYVQTAYFYLVRLAICRGDSLKLKKELQNLQSLNFYMYPQSGSFMKKLCEASIVSMIETPSCQSVLRTLPAPSLDSDTFYYPVAPIATVMQHKLMLSRGNYSQLLPQAAAAYKAARSSSYLAAIYEAILLACCHEHANAIDKAAAALKEGMLLAQPDHIIMPFAEHAEYLQQTLEYLTSDASVSSFVQQICHYSIAPALSALRIALVQQSFPLSKRELEIAAMVAAGMTNKTIAHNLHIAEVTVKKTLSQIYRKLGITNRVALSHYMSNYPAP